AGHLVRRHHDLRGEQARTEPLDLLRLEALGGETDALLIEHARRPRAAVERARERERALEAEKVDEEIRAGVRVVVTRRGAELGGPEDACPWEHGVRRERARLSLPGACILVAPHVALVVEMGAREQLEIRREPEARAGLAAHPLDRGERVVARGERQQE